MIEVPGYTQGGAGRVDVMDRVPDTGPSYADVSEQLLMEFGPKHGLLHVSELLRRCRGQLAADPLTSSPQALERLARAALSVAVVPVPRRVTR